MKTLSEFLEIPEGVEFKISGFNGIYKIQNNELLHKSQNLWCSSIILLSTIINRKIIMVPKQLLTNKEREYLKAVIKPYRDKIENIEKHSIGFYECIRIYFKYCSPMNFPTFDKGKYYNGLQIGENYTLADLGLED